jgi:hypothetical protein
MNFTQMGRVAAQLRRIARALETANDLEERRQDRDYPLPPARGSKLVEIHNPTVAEWNAAYQKAHPERAED